MTSVVVANDGTPLDLDNLAQTIVVSGGTTTIAVNAYSTKSGQLQTFTQTIVDNGSGTTTISAYIES